MRIIMLVLVTVAVFSFMQKAHGRTIILEEEPVESQGKVIYILTMCKDGKQFTGYHNGELLDFKIIQEFEADANSGKLIPTECQMDFRSDEQLEK